MSQIVNRSFNAEPKELVPSRGVNDIQDNIIRTSFDLWALADLLKEGSAEFASIMFSDMFNVDRSKQSSNVMFYYDENNNIEKIVLGNNKSVEFSYENNLISKATIYYISGDYHFVKTFIFNYDSNDNIINVNIE